MTWPSQARAEASRRVGIVLRAVRGPVGRESAEQMRCWDAEDRGKSIGVRKLGVGGVPRPCSLARSMGAPS